LMPGTIHSTEKYANKRAELLHEATGLRERDMRKFKSVGQAPRFVTAGQKIFHDLLLCVI
jgi:putative transposase